MPLTLDCVCAGDSVVCELKALRVNYKNFIGQILVNDSANSANAQLLEVAAWYLNTTAVNAFNVRISSGTFGGTVRVYGIRNT